MILYYIKNNINNKLYIGKTSKNIKKRFNKHLYCVRNKINRRLYDSMNKHGLDNFSYGIIYESKSLSNPALNLLEVIAINFFKSYYTENGYNMTKGGDGGVMSPEVRKRISEKKKGQKHTEESKRKISESNKNKKYGPPSNDTKEKISKSLKNKWQNDIEYREIMTEINKNKAKSGKDHHMYGKHHTDDAKRKIREKGKGRVNSEKQKLIAKELFTGKTNPNYKNIDLEEVIRLIKEEKLTIKEIANLFNITKEGLYYKIKAETGKSITEVRKEKDV